MAFDLDDALDACKSAARAYASFCDAADWVGFCKVALAFLLPFVLVVLLIGSCSYGVF